MRTCILCVLLLTAMQASSIASDEPDNLLKIRTALESQLASIKTIRVVYKEVAETAIDPAVKAIFEATLEQERKAAAVGGPLRPSPIRLTRFFDLLDAFPSARMRVREERKFASGEITTIEVNTCFHDGRLVQLRPLDRHADILTAGNRSFVPESPLNAIGLRLPGTDNTTVLELLSATDLVAPQPAQTIGKVQTVVLKIGPGLSSRLNLPNWGDEDYVRLYLAPGLSYVPVRTEIIRPSPLAPELKDRPSFVYESSDFRRVPDIGREGRTVYFPYQSTYKNLGGIHMWSVESVHVNPSIGAMEFDQSVPKGYNVVKDGKIIAN